MDHVTVAVHQPNYLPWLGYFYKIACSDVFIFLDTVQFARRGYTHRVHVMGTDGEPHWLTQNIRKREIEVQVITGVEFADRSWAKKHLRTIECVYGRSPHLGELMALIEPRLLGEESKLSVVNGDLIKAVASALGLKTRIVCASEIEIGPVSTPSERIARLVHHFGARRYLSGHGARAYNDEATFARYNIEVEYSDYRGAEYPQAYPPGKRGFTPGLSVVDALCNVGPEELARYLKR